MIPSAVGWRRCRVPPVLVWGVRGARGRERAGPTRSHPEPGRDPAQRRRVLWGRPHGRRGRRGHPSPSGRRRGGEQARRPGRPRRASPRARTRRGVEQRQLVGLITQRSGVRIPPPLPDQNAATIRCRRCCFFQHASVVQSPTGNCALLKLPEVASTPSDVPQNSPSIWFTRSAAPGAVGGAPGFATTVIMRCRASPLRGATDAAFRRPTLVASARRRQ
jgi:hypothetical protein